MGLRFVGLLSGRLVQIRSLRERNPGPSAPATGPSDGAPSVEAGVGFNRLLKLIRGFIETVLLGQQTAEIVPGLRKTWLASQCFSELLLRAPSIALPKCDDTQ